MAGESILRYLYGGRILLQGTELIGVAAGEAEDPERTCQKRLIQSSRRILFYIGAFTVIGFLIPYNKSIEF